LYSLKNYAITVDLTSFCSNLMHVFITSMNDKLIKKIIMADFDGVSGVGAEQSEKRVCGSGAASRTFKDRSESGVGDQ
jgi:hypothetical protein